MFQIILKDLQSNGRTAIIISPKSENLNEVVSSFNQQLKEKFPDLYTSHSHNHRKKTKSIYVGHKKITVW